MRLPDMRKDAEAVLGRVSVVQMARESSAKERAEARRLRASIGRARRIFSTGSWTPMTPVEQTKTSRAGRPRRLEVSSTVRREARSPCWPVAQLAFPALTTTARMRPLDSARCFLERVTGAATTRFCVKTAAADAGTSLERMARSSAPVFLRPQAVAAKRKPLGRAASVGAWVTWWLQCRGFFFRDRRWRRERSPGMYHREPFSQLARRRRTSFSRSRLQIPGRPFAILRVEVR